MRCQQDSTPPVVRAVARRQIHEERPLPADHAELRGWETRLLLSVKSVKSVVAFLWSRLAELGDLRAIPDSVAPLPLCALCALPFNNSAPLCHQAETPISAFPFLLSAFILPPVFAIRPNFVPFAPFRGHSLSPVFGTKPNLPSSAICQSHSFSGRFFATDGRDFHGRESEEFLSPDSESG